MFSPCFPHPRATKATFVQSIALNCHHLPANVLGAFGSIRLICIPSLGLSHGFTTTWLWWTFLILPSPSPAKKSTTPPTISHPRTSVAVVNRGEVHDVLHHGAIDARYHMCAASSGVQLVQQPWMKRVHQWSTQLLHNIFIIYMYIYIIYMHYYILYI